MNKKLIAQFETNISAIWDLSDAEKIQKVSAYFQELLHESELKSDLLISLTEEKSSTELLRSIKDGFILTAYTESEGQYRSPHNHGAGWVIYGILDGEMEMSTYEFNAKLIFKESYSLEPKDFKVYLPDQIHDTRGKAIKSVVLRFTSCDLKQEEREGRMKRF
jgi:predicted metal-dependent enzyme (double-stranded beta helix superfamily)